MEYEDIIVEKEDAQACSTEGSNEGTKAFLEKRKANFQGK